MVQKCGIILAMLRSTLTTRRQPDAIIYYIQYSGYDKTISGKSQGLTIYTEYDTIETVKQTAT